MSEEEVLVRRDPSPDTEFEPAMAQRIEHDQLFEQAHRMVERKADDGRDQLHASRLPCERSQENRLRRRRRQAVPVVLRQVVAVEAACFCPLHELDSLFVELLYRLVAASLDVIED